ncbi:MAG TPA: tyrosinase family protein [Anaerolineae bacterium]|nr:tyrosinase family protein [Anaerolineae bacterium]
MSKKVSLMIALIAITLLVIALFSYVPTLKQVSSFLIASAKVGGTITCENLTSISISDEFGLGYPGVAGAPTWGLPTDNATEPLRVRRSWSTLTDEEKKQFVDGIVLLKQTTATSALPGAQRADYQSFCPTEYERNLYDYYVELHISAFTTMGSAPMSTMAHGAPHFLPWHRYLLLRMEKDMQTVLNDPTFTLPYWDWDDCSPGKEDGSNPCPQLFELDFLGSHGGATDDEAIVQGYLIDQGYEVNVWVDNTLLTIYNTDGIRCGSRPLQRQTGTNQETNGLPPSSIETIDDGYLRPLYDIEPYDACSTDDTISFRMFLEGFRPTDTDIFCFSAGNCARHGLGHTYIGGDMSFGGAVPEPIFFLHHANVDRIWAMWQDNNRQNPDTAVDYGNPGFPDMWRVPLFNFPEVMVSDTFDFRALGYEYDTTP